MLVLLVLEHAGGTRPSPTGFVPAGLFRGAAPVGIADRVLRPEPPRATILVRKDWGKCQTCAAPPSLRAPRSHAAGRRPPRRPAAGRGCRVRRCGRPP